MILLAYIIITNGSTDFIATACVGELVWESLVALMLGRFIKVGDRNLPQNLINKDVKNFK